jgi:NADH-quinone oxidoreductase subunit J
VNVVFALSGIVAVAATVMMITRRSAVHALLYFVVSLLASAVIMFVLGAAFVAALEVIVYAGAIMVLFVFVIMLIGPESIAVAPRAWIGPSVLAAVLLGDLAWILSPGAAAWSPARSA